MNTTMQPPLALVEMYEDGTYFPLRLDLQSMNAALSAKRWQLIGPGQFCNWQIVETESLDPAKADLKIFTKLAQDERINQIIKAKSELTK